MAAKDMSVALLVIGDEILRGDTLDSNSNYLARRLAERGARLRRILTIPDDMQLIASEAAKLAKNHDRLITTGGIGPTPDDLTRDAIAAAFGLEMELNEVAVNEWRSRKGSELNEGQLAMCTLPRGARLIKTISTSAPGFVIHNVYVLAGVPSVMKEMWQSIEHEFHGNIRSVRSFKVKMPESHFAGLLRDFQDRYPHLDFGSYPKMADDWYTEIKVIGDIEEDVAEVCNLLEAAIGDLV